MTNDEKHEQAMRRAMQHMEGRRLTYWGFRFNFRQWRWGKMGPLALGLLIEAAFLACLTAPAWMRDDVGTSIALCAFGALAEVVLYIGHRRNFNGKQG